MAGDGLRGIRSGTPVPSQERESRRSPNEVYTQNWGSERVKQYLEEKYGTDNQAKPSTAPRLYTNWERKDGMEMTTFTLTREEYLEERRTGKGRTHIAKENEISTAGLLYHLRKWGLVDPVIEEVEMDKVSKTGPRKEVTTATEEVAPAIDVQMSYEKSSEPTEELEEEAHYITIRVPLAFEGWPQEVKDAPIQSVDRDSTIKVGAQMLQNAVAWAWKELSDILGPGDYTEQVQQFIDRKLATVSE